MSRLIDADELSKYMYHEAFETDTDMQKWDSGCWIRYKMFKNAIDNAPTVDVVEVVRCKDCKYGRRDNDVLYRCACTDFDDYNNANHFCSYGERRTDE